MTALRLGRHGERTLEVARSCHLVLLLYAYWWWVLEFFSFARDLYCITFFRGRTSIVRLSVWIFWQFRSLS
jgi:hypothetical protein